MGPAGLGALVGVAAEGFVLCFAVAAAADLVLGRRTQLTGPVGSRQIQWRRLMVLSVGRLLSDAVGLVAVFFLLAREWALIGGALGLLSWRGIWLAFGARPAATARQHARSLPRTQTGGSEGAVS